jgi:hypothetical protein
MRPVEIERPSEPPITMDNEERYRIAFDALVEIRNLDRSKWTPEAIKAHETLMRLGWRP